MCCTQVALLLIVSDVLLHVLSVDLVSSSQPVQPFRFAVALPVIAGTGSDTGHWPYCPIFGVALSCFLRHSADSVNGIIHKRTRLLVCCFCHSCCGSTAVSSACCICQHHAVRLLRWHRAVLRGICGSHWYIVAARNCSLLLETVSCTLHTVCKQFEPASAQLSSCVHARSPHPSVNDGGIVSMAFSRDLHCLAAYYNYLALAKVGSLLADPLHCCLALACFCYQGVPAIVCC